MCMSCPARTRPKALIAGLIRDRGSVHLRHRRGACRAGCRVHSQPRRISVSYTNDADFHTDELVSVVGVRIKKVGDAHAQANEPLTIKLDLDIMRLKRDGLDGIGYAVL
jgi:hypothetical protein